MKQKLIWVEYAKAIGITLMVYGHVARGVYNADLPINEDFFWFVDKIIYNFHMPLFFFLSGIFLINSLEKWGRANLFKIKLSTIAYPYILWSIIQGSLEVFLNSYTNHSIDFADVLSLLHQPRAQFWFLYTLFFIFVFSILAYRRQDTQFVAALFLFSLGLYVFEHEIPGRQFHIYFSNYMVFFAGGVLFSKLQEMHLFKSGKILITIFLLFVVCQYIFVTYGDTLNEYPRTFANLMVAYTGIFFVISLCQYYSETSVKSIELIGQATLSIYLLHVIFGSGFRIIAAGYFGITSVPFHLVAGTVFGLIVPVLVLHFARKLGFNFMFAYPIKKPVKRESTS